MSESQEARMAQVNSEAQRLLEDVLAAEDEQATESAKRVPEDEQVTKSYKWVAPTPGLLPTSLGLMAAREARASVRMDREDPEGAHDE